jgi:heat shock protein HtpX
MRRYHLYQALEAARVSKLEERSMLAGALLLVAAVMAVFAGAAEVARALGTAGLAGAGSCASSRAVRLYRAGVTASLPTRVARVRVRVRPARAFVAACVVLAVGLPVTVALAALVLVEWAWLVLACVLVPGCAGLYVIWSSSTRHGEPDYAKSSALAEELLRRLCLRIDVPVPELVVEPAYVASAWTARGELHVTTGLLKLLDDGELEAVLAHELAHVARRDAAAMEICSAPSRVLLAYAESLRTRLARWLDQGWLELGVFGGYIMAMIALLGALCLPWAYAIGWVARLSVLGMSRAREFAADAAAVTLTGRPSALASALMKLDRQRDWAPRADLRRLDAHAMLCIVGTAKRGLGRLLSSHPPTAARVKRLEAIEARIQAGPYAP